MRSSAVALTIALAVRTGNTTRVTVVVSAVVAGEIKIVHATRQIAVCPGRRGIMRSPHITRNGRRLPEPPVRLCVHLFIDNDDHPYSHAAALAQQWCAVYPARPAFFV